MCHDSGPDIDDDSTDGGNIEAHDHDNDDNVLQIKQAKSCQVKVVDSLDATATIVIMTTMMKMMMLI